MSTPAFTPGPLRVERAGPAPRCFVVTDAGIALAATYGQPTQEGDARLYAAAPELYDACDEIVAEFDRDAADHENENPGERLYEPAGVAFARAALVKARSQTFGTRPSVDDAARVAGSEPKEAQDLSARLLDALRDLREASTEAYKAGRIPAEPFVRAGNVIAEAEGGQR